MPTATAKKTAAPAKRNTTAPAPGLTPNPTNEATLLLRLFEPKREKREYLLDENVLASLATYEAYLFSLYKQKPATNKVVELLIEEALGREANFQAWRSQQTRQKESITPQMGASRPVLEELEDLPK